MSPAPAQNDPPSLLQLPSELRIEIYRNLLCINRTRQQKPLSESQLSTSRYRWNLHTAILATCRQINDEARTILIRENSFVVFECATRSLDQINAKYVDTFPPGLKLWSGKKQKKVPITSQVMKVRLQKCQRYKPTRCSIYVVLEDEVLDLCAGLATYHRPVYGCRVAELSLHVVIGPWQAKESSETQASREATLLRSVMALRNVAEVEVEGAARELARDVSFRLSRQLHSKPIVSQAVTGLFSAGDNAFDIGDYTAALGYYCRASDYYIYCAGQGGYLTDTGDWLVFSLTLNQKRARSQLEIQDFQSACFEMHANIFIATGEFLTQDPKPTEGVLWPVTHKIILPSMSEEENSTEEDRRRWKCKRLQEAAARFKQRITCEDIGRCYMYRSIALRCTTDKSPSLAAEDRLMSLACCDHSSTSGDDYINELLELERRMMKYFIRE